MHFYKEENLIRLIKYTPLFFILLVGALLSSYIYTEAEYFLENEQEESYNEFVQTNNVLVKEQVEHIYNLILTKQAGLEQSLKQSLQKEAMTAFILTKNLYEHSITHHSKEETQNLILNNLKQLQLQQKKDTVFVTNLEGRLLLDSTKSLQQKTPFITNETQSFQSWQQSTPDASKKTFKKIAFVKYFKPLGWYIGVSAYVKDYEALLQQEILSYVNSIRFSTKGFVLINDYHANNLAHVEKEFAGKNLLLLNKHNEGLKQIWQKALTTAKGEGGYLSAKLPMASEKNKKVQKTAFIKAYEKWGWVIAAGYYNRDMMLRMQKQQEHLQERHNLFLERFFLYGGALIMLVLFISFFTSKVLKNLFRTYKKEIASHNYVIDKHILSYTLDLSQNITQVSSAFCTHFGYSQDELLQQKPPSFKHLSPQQMQEIQTCLNTRQTCQKELFCFTKKGQKVWIKTTLTPLLNKEGKLIGYSGILQDITDKKKVESLSIHDKLTQLYNRMKLDDVFAYELKQAKRYNLPLSIIIFDIDKFKEVNDNYGHQVGDSVLQEVASLLKSHKRDADTIGRWGGEEFLIIAPKTPTQKAFFLADRLRLAFEAHHFKTVGQKTCSFGVASFHENDSFDSLLERADKALYEAKNGGRNRVCCLEEL